MRTVSVYVAWVCLILASTSCSHVVRRPFDREVTEHMDVEKPWIELEGWTDASGGKHQRKGYAQVTADSMLIYDQEPSRKGEPAREAALSMPRSEVTEVHVRKFSVVKTSIVVAVPIALLLGMAAGMGTVSMAE